jgi:hypothetical protein
MTGLDDNTKRASHGLFYMENAGGTHAEPAPPTQPSMVEEHQPSCFALEEERGEGWDGAGASGPLVKETTPTL